jgi:glyceraldehyde-3-phosphate dehydrogenase (NADP+)
MDTPDKPVLVEQREYLIDGQLRAWDGPVQEVRSPVIAGQPEATAEPIVLGHYPLLGEAESLAALDAAARAYDSGRGAWPTLPVEGRIAAVERFAFLMRERRDDVVRLLMWEIGKTLPDSEKEFDRTIQYIRDTIDALKDLDRTSSRFTIAEGIVGQIRRAPLGVALCMGPFNYPLNETFTTLIPALIMGNTVVFKPAKFGVLLLRPLLEAFRDAFPPGVVNTVYGEGRTIVTPLMASGKVDCLAFIGTSRVADSLKKQHPAPHRLRSVLGLDAKNPAIVLADADLDLALAECVLGALSFNGQRCTAIKIVFVHEALYDRFVEGFATRVDALRRGNPWDAGVQITPLPETGKIDYLRALLDDAVAHGARVANPLGGRVEGRLFSPAVVAPVRQDMRLWREEQFGPIVPVAPFSDVAEPLRYIVESNYGQQVSLFGRDPQTIGALIDPLVNQVSRVNLNSQCQRGPDLFPFTGRKDSAEGTLSVSDALRVFSIRALVAAKGTDANKALVSAILRERRSNWLSTDFLF